MSELPISLATLFDRGLDANVLRADFDDLIKGLLVLAFFVMPALRSIVKKVNEAMKDKTPVGGRPATRTPSGPPARPSRPVTWQDLMRGDLPEPEPQREELPQAEAHFPSGPSSAPAPLTGAGVFDDVPDEGQLEYEAVGQTSPDGGVDEGLETVFDTSWASLDTPPSTELGPIDGEPGELPFDADDTLVAALERRAVAAPVRERALAWLRPDDWRRTIVLTEVLGPPLALRERHSHPGPPASTR